MVVATEDYWVKSDRYGAAEEVQKAKTLELYKHRVREGIKITSSEIAAEIVVTTSSVQAILHPEGKYYKRKRQWYVGCSESPATSLQIL